MASSVALATSGTNKNEATLTSKAPPQSMVRAFMELYTPGPKGAGASLGKIDFQFNPKEFSIAKSAKWERKPGRGAKKAAMPEFTGSDGCKLSFELFFDATDSPAGGVIDRVEKLFSCCVPLEGTGQKVPSPPWVLFCWGSVRSFVAAVTSVNAKYTLFRPDGTPVRAVCQVTLEEIPGVPRPQNPTSGGLAARRTHTIVTGDTLQSVAYREYGDPTHWRALAEVNGIDDPMRIPSGTSLLIPAPGELV
jgi:hypothetical protein